MLVLNFVFLNDLVGLEDGMLLHLDHLVDERLHNSNTHLIVACLVLVIDRDQIQVDADEDALNVELVDELLKDLAQLQKALDDETGELHLHSVVLVSPQ